MKLEGSRVLQGFGRNSPGPADTTIQVPPIVNLAVAPRSPIINFGTQNLTSPANVSPLADSFMFVFADTRANQALTAVNGLYTLAEGVWELILRMCTFADFNGGAVLVNTNFLSITSKNGLQTTHLMRQFLGLTTNVVDDQTYYLALAEPMTLNVSMSGAGVGQINAMVLTVVANRLQ